MIRLKSNVFHVGYICFGGFLGYDYYGVLVNHLISLWCYISTVCMACGREGVWVLCKVVLVRYGWHRLLWFYFILP